MVRFEEAIVCCILTICNTDARETVPLITSLLGTYFINRTYLHE